MSQPSSPQKYADLVMAWLAELGYTHCFFVAGGNIMHLLDGARKTMTCVPVVHEVAGGIAAEYFNESGGEGRAFLLVTAGPGITNATTAMAGAWLESRELLVVGGQVKSTDLATGGVRQRGIQEIDGVAIAAPLCVEAVRIEEPWHRKQFADAVLAGRRGRPGPVFIEMCLDAQGAPVDATAQGTADASDAHIGPPAKAVTAAAVAADEIYARMRDARRPLWLIGGGVTRATAAAALDRLVATGVPVMTTWNGTDRVPHGTPTYLGRPNTWGQRSANVLVAQSDLVVAFGTRLGLQQTGFNWQEFGRGGTVVQVDIDAAELEKGHPRVDLAFEADANALLADLVGRDYPDYSEWLAFGREVRELLPVNEPCNLTGDGFVCPYEFYLDLSALATSADVLIPCSSGAANSVAMQTIVQKRGQVIVTDKGLASMGYGLAGAIGAALAHPNQRTILVEGDGGFAQNLQELATVAVNDLDLKIFIHANEGYGSIRTTQKNYFGGAYLGCDTQTGLGFPDWLQLFAAYGVPAMNLAPGWNTDPAFRTEFDARGPRGFIVPIDTEQTYWPKITSRVTETGSMESQPLHLMSPDLPEDLAARVFKYL
ncbi:MAG: thiamine pyrophosphate-binding protein [Actinomycetota bacterium]